MIWLRTGKSVSDLKMFSFQAMIWILNIMVCNRQLFEIWTKNEQISLYKPNLSVWAEIHQALLSQFSLLVVAVRD